MAQKELLIGVDLGAQTAKIGIVNKKGKILNRTRIQSDDTTDENIFVKNLCEAIVKLLTEQGVGLNEVYGIGNGKLLNGHDGFAGELGHTYSGYNEGRRCNCGKLDYLESYTSAFAVAYTAREFLRSKPERPTLLRNLILNKITSEDVFNAAMQGDELSKEIFSFTAKVFGERLSDFAAFSAPQAIVLFGGLMKAGEFLLNPVKEHFKKNLLCIWQEKIQILASGLEDDDAAILGAAALVIEEVGSEN